MIQIQHFWNTYFGKNLKINATAKEKKYTTQMSIRELSSYFVLVPNLRATVLEELKKLRNHNVEWSVQSVTVQQLWRVLADLLQCSKRALRHGHTQRGCQITTQTYTDTKERLRWHQKICHRQRLNSQCASFCCWIFPRIVGKKINSSEADFCYYEVVELYMTPLFVF